MNLYTFTSEIHWRRFVIVYAAVALGLGFVLGAGVLALDPYDAGRFALFGSHGVPETAQSLMDASLGRDPHFNTAIIGNSTVQALEPAQMDSKGVRVVNLAVLGAGPREQLTIAQWFLDHHPGTARAVVIGLDQRWCEANRPLTLAHPFPFWLYDSNDAVYIANMMQSKTLEAAGDKIKLLLGSKQAMRSDGYKDYAAGRVWNRDDFYKHRDESLAELNDLVPAVAAPYDFAAVSLLRDFLAHGPADIEIVLVVPPRFHPETSGNAAFQQHDCEQAYRLTIAKRPHSQFIDFLARPSLTGHEEDYWDHMHQSARLVGVMEREIKAALSP